VQPESKVNVHIFLHDSHWMPIINLNCFYREQRKSSYYICPKCLKSFYELSYFNRHIDEPCNGSRSVQRETIPKSAILQFSDYEKCTSTPYVMYADIEALLRELPVEAGNTIKTH